MDFLGSIVCPSRLNHDYSFLHHFDVVHAIRNKANSIDDVLDVFKSAVGEENIREIIVNYLNSRIVNSNDFQPISKMHQKFNANKNTSISINTKNNVCETSTVFQIQNLMCSIFSFLDFRSLLKCSRVNVQWLYDSYHPASLIHINTSGLYKQNNMHAKGLVFDTFYNINRFKNVTSVTVTPFPHQLNEYFTILDKFHDIRKLNLVYDTYDEMVNLNKIIENNKYRLKQLTIGTNKSRTQDGFQEWKFLKSAFLPCLETLYVRDIMMNSFYSNKEQQTFETNNFNRLEKVEVTDARLGIGFWRDLADDKSYLSNIKSLSFDECGLDNVDSIAENTIKSCYIPKITAKLDNLTHFRCTATVACLYRSSRVPLPLPEIVPAFLRHLSLNERARESLRNIEVCLFWGTNEFLPKEKTSSDDNIIINKINSNGDEFVLNFLNLKSVSILFSSLIIPEPEVSKLKQCDQSQLICKALGIFCMRKTGEQINVGDAMRDDSLSIDCDSAATGVSGLSSIINKKNGVSNEQNTYVEMLCSEILLFS